ncbi:MAG: XRE family transcriptional regulator [Bacteroidaceae bacterium]|nr:XRE family transcriptional regulator [Bacteroidaceae bacterium]
MKDIGELIKEELIRQERSVSWLARKLSCDRSNIYRIFQKQSIDTSVLKRISIILNHDFFVDLSNELNN